MRTVSISLQSENDIYLRVKMEKKMLLNIHAKFLHWNQWRNFVQKDIVVLLGMQTTSSADVMNSLIS